jgi:serine protease Do
MRMHFAMLLLTYLGAIPFVVMDRAEAQEKKPTDERKAVEKDKAGKEKSDKSKSDQKQDPFLGVSVSSLHPAFWAHLNDLLEHKQGVLVAEVAKGSPAEKAGIKTHDILIAIDDQKLFAPQQLFALVHEEKIGQKVKIELLRGGKGRCVEATLAEHPAPAITTPPSPLIASLNGRSPAWEKFDSLTMKNLGKGRYKVEIAYLAKDGRLEHRGFEGTREEIRRDILAQKDMPESEREDLLAALNMPSGIVVEFPHFHVLPDGRVLFEFGDFERF